MIAKIISLLQRYAFHLLIPLVLFFSFYRLGHQPVHQWDEARTGINAIEMLENGDYINLHFGGEPDKIRAKPPLVVWMVAANFKIFGPSAWSLRLHSAIATVFIFIFLFYIIRLYESGIFALTTCLILLSVRGVIGFHVGRTGDFDAVLIALLLGGLYYFLKYLREESGVRSQGLAERSRGQERGAGNEGRDGEPLSELWLSGVEASRSQGTKVDRPLFLAAILWGFAFLTKGPAMGVLFPGLFLFLVMTRQLKQLLFKKEVYFALGLCLLFPIAWYLTVHFFGVQLDRPEVSGRNAFERMFLYDLVDRFTQTEFEGKTETSDWLFFFRCLKENFAVWHYFFYATIIGGIVFFIKKERFSFAKLSKFNKSKKSDLLVLSICIWSTLGLFLSMVTTAKFWYLAPAIPFIAITLVYGLKWLEKRFKWLPYCFLVIWVLAMYFRYLGPKPQPTEGSETPDFFTELVDQHKDVLTQSDRIYVTPNLPAQRVLLLLHFANEELVYLPISANLDDLNQNDILFIRLNDPVHQTVLGDYERLAQDKNYVILRKKL